MTKRKEMSDYPEMDYFMNEESSDVVFIINGQRLPALKSFLSVRNKVFRVMFSDNFKESKDKEVVIKDTTFDAFKTLIQFFHSEELVLKDGNDLKLIDEVYQLSDRYEANRLFDKMAIHMTTIKPSFENIELISRIAERSQNIRLINSVLYFINANIDNIFTKDNNQLNEMNELTHNYLLRALVNKGKELNVYKEHRCPRY